MTAIVLASNNPKKRDELAAALALHLPTVTILTLEDVGLSAPVEDADTFVGNALIKARHCVKASGYAAIADDSGLCVDVLNGAPGVYSARYAGEHASDVENNQRLIDTLLATGGPQPFTAAFHAAVVFATPKGDEHVVERQMPGVITLTPRGTNGFGYDPLFLSDAYGYTRTNAELTQAEKQQISHRGQALGALLDTVIAYAQQPDETLRG